MQTIYYLPPETVESAPEKTPATKNPGKSELSTDWWMDTGQHSMGSDEFITKEPNQELSIVNWLNRLELSINWMDFRYLRTR